MVRFLWQWVAVLGATLLFGAVPPVLADSDTAGRLEREAQQASNSGRYEEARQLREIASALRSKDSVTSKQVQSETVQRHFDKAKEMLQIR